MSAFRYLAARVDGGRIRGRMEAASAADAVHVLGDRGLFPLSVEAERPPSHWPWRGRPTRTLATALQSLSGLAEVGVPLHHALSATADLVDGPVRDALIRVRERVREGSPLWAALAEQGDMFSAVTVGLVRAGERGVGLAAGLGQAAQQLEREAETQSNLQAALAYPLVLLLVGSLSIGFIVLVVLPRFAALLTDVEATLPPATRFLIGASAFLREHGLLVMTVCLVLVALATRLVMTYREAWATRLLELPVIGPVRHGLATARVARALGALIGTGVSAVPALAVARDTAGDAAVARRLQAAEQRVAEGTSLGHALHATRALTPAAIRLVRIGERTGRLPDLLEQAAELEERTAARRVRALVTALEPAFIVAFAALVAFIAGAVLQALYAVRPGAL